MAGRAASNVPKIFFYLSEFQYFCFEGCHQLVFLSFAVLNPKNSTF